MGVRPKYCFQIWLETDRQRKNTVSKKGASPSKMGGGETHTPDKEGNVSEADAGSKKQLMLGAANGDEEQPVGQSYVGEVDKKELLAEANLLEALYETRVGSAERLLSFMVIFHRAVKPLSRLWFISYDIDRSESRLRVASTPAPIPFVEHLPGKAKWAKAVVQIQRASRKYIKKQRGDDTARGSTERVRPIRQYQNAGINSKLS